MKKKIFKALMILAISAMFCSCGQGGTSKEAKTDEEKTELPAENVEELSNELDQTTEELQKDVEEMDKEVDALLEGL